MCSAVFCNFIIFSNDSNIFNQHCFCISAYISSILPWHFNMIIKIRPKYSYLGVLECIMFFIEDHTHTFISKRKEQILVKIPIQWCQSTHLFLLRIEHIWSDLQMLPLCLQLYHWYVEQWCFFKWISWTKYSFWSRKLNNIDQTLMTAQGLTRVPAKVWSSQTWYTRLRIR